MTDREFINKLIDNFFSNAIDPHMVILNNAIANRLRDIADKLDKYKEEENNRKEIKEC